NDRIVTRPHRMRFGVSWSRRYTRRVRAANANGAQRHECGAVRPLKAYRLLAPNAGPSMTLTYRILAEHLVHGRLVAGEEVQLRADKALLQDATGTMACLELESLGARSPREPNTAGADAAAVRPALEHFEALGVERIGIPFGIVYVD